MAKKIEVQIVGDASSYSRALRGAEKDTKAFGSGLDRAVGTAAKTGVFAAAAAGITAVGVTLRAGIKEYAEAARVGAQTNAVIKSTGGIANVTAGDVDKLSGSLMRKSGVDDEVIAKGQNMLLTFKNIRNEAGAGNDVFNQATKATLDLSVAMGTDMSKSAIMVGKALNDPIRGLGAMRRVGIQFTDAQEKMIKGMVESGDVMGAQKVILKELNSQFGGSAKAMGETLPGQIDILKERFNNFAGDLVARAIPAVTRFFDFVGKVGEAKTISAKIDIVLEGVSSTVGNIWDQIQVAFQGETRRIQTREGVEIEVVEPKIVVDWGEIRRQIDEGFASALESDEGQGPIDQINEKWTSKLGEVADNLGEWAKAQPRRIASDFRAGLNANDLTADFGKWIVDPIRSAAANAVPGPIRNLVNTIVTGFRQGIPDFVGAVTSMMSSGIAGVRARFGEAFNAAVGLGDRIVSGILSGLSDLVSSVRGKLNGIITTIAKVAGDAYAMAVGIGGAIVRGVIGGLVGLAGAVADKIAGGIRAGIALAGRLTSGSGPFQFTIHTVGEPMAEGIIIGLTKHLERNLPRNLAGILDDTIGGVPIGGAAEDGGRTVARGVKEGLDDHLETNLPSNLQTVISDAVKAASGTGFGVPIGQALMGPPAPLPLTHKTSPFGGSVIANPDTMYIGTTPIIVKVGEAELARVVTEQQFDLAKSGHTMPWQGRTGFE